MKSKVASSFTCRARSARKIAEPLSTATRITGCPAKSRVISAPNSTILFAISSREISTLSSAMAFHIKLNHSSSPCRHTFRYKIEPQDIDRRNIVNGSQRHSTYMAWTRNFSHRHARRPHHHYRSLDHEQPRMSPV